MHLSTHLITEALCLVVTARYVDNTPPSMASIALILPSYIWHY